MKKLKTSLKIFAIMMSMVFVFAMIACGSTDSEPVVDKTLTKIDIIQFPAQTAYVEGEKLDLSGIKVMATFSDDSTEDVTAEVATSIEGRTLTAADTYCYILYTYKGVRKSVKIDISVSAEPEDEEPEIFPSPWTVALNSEADYVFATFYSRSTQNTFGVLELNGNLADGNFVYREAYGTALKYSKSIVIKGTYEIAPDGVGQSYADNNICFKVTNIIRSDETSTRYALSTTANPFYVGVLESAIAASAAVSTYNGTSIAAISFAGGSKNNNFFGLASSAASQTNPNPDTTMTRATGEVYFLAVVNNNIPKQLSAYVPAA